MPRRGLLLEMGSERVLVDKSPFVIGRASISDLPIIDGNISRRHCEISRRGDGWMIRDLGSTGGFRVDDQKIRAPMPLQVGSRIVLCDYLLRVVSLDHEAADGELLGPLRRTLTFACRRVTCRFDVPVTSWTSNAAVVQVLDALVRDAEDLDDPVAVVAAVRAFEELRVKPIAGVVVRGGTRPQVVIDAHACALLTEVEMPARTMWDWLWRHERDRLVQPASALAGIASVPYPQEELSVPPPELVAAVSGEPGPLEWIHQRGLGQLVRVTRAMRIPRGERTRL